MNIQANSPNSSLISPAKKPLSKPAQATERIDNPANDEKQANNLAPTSDTERTKLFDQLESLDKKQAVNFRPSALENKNQSSIQSYITTQSLAEQELRDELQQQLGIDVLA